MVIAHDFILQSALFGIILSVTLANRVCLHTVTDNKRISQLSCSASLIVLLLYSSCLESVVYAVQVSMYVAGANLILISLCSIVS